METGEDVDGQLDLMAVESGERIREESAETASALTKSTDVEQYILGRIHDAKAAISTCVSMPELKEMRAEASAIAVLAKQQKASLDVQNEAAALKLSVERRIGQILKVLEKNKGAAGGKDENAPPTLEEMGIDKSAADRWQKIANLSDEDFDRYLEGCKLSKQEITQADVLRIAKGHELNKGGGHSSESNEWYTPKEIIELAREVLGKIDLDPASCAFANEVVQAENFFSQEQDGFSRDWFGNVWLNPPYGRAEDDHASNKGRWSKRLADQYRAGKVAQGILLVNPDIGTNWFNQLWPTGDDGAASALCFTEKRIKFYNAEGTAKSPPRGGAGAIAYFGPSPEIFAEKFKSIGVVILKVVKAVAEISAEGKAA
jgi:hypothetical protein